ncbi:hypothetical protein Glove_299g104 [Diversispora epigaea]|uniref:Uncharacterized protein n=1 Tax=Diversispora epigaea TaxID=1348612 RepID=A0A397HWX0_9GLOM|nr:hypothetical protein Glove_299g104 [Diversispora epigaea]
MRHFISTNYKLRRYDSDLEKLKHRSSYYFDDNIKITLKNDLENNLEENRNQLDRDGIKPPSPISSSSHSYPIQIAQ